MRRACAVLLAVSAAGCLSETPIAPGAAVPVDDNLIGVWRCVTPDEDGVVMIRVARQNATTYSGTTAGPGEKPSAFEAHLVGDGPHRVANVKDLETKGAERWTLVRPTLLRPDVLHLELIDHDRYRAHRADIAAALRDPERRDTLFGDLSTCVRVRPRS